MNAIAPKIRIVEIFGGRAAEQPCDAVADEGGLVVAGCVPAVDDRGRGVQQAGQVGVSRSLQVSDALQLSLLLLARGIMKRISMISAAAWAPDGPGLADSTRSTAAAAISALFLLVAHTHTLETAIRLTRLDTRRMSATRHRAVEAIPGGKAEDGKSPKSSGSGSSRPHRAVQTKFWDNPKSSVPHLATPAVRRDWSDQPVPAVRDKRIAPWPTRRQGGFKNGPTRRCLNRGILMLSPGATLGLGKLLATFGAHPIGACPKAMPKSPSHAKICPRIEQIRRHLALGLPKVCACVAWLL